MRGAGRGAAAAARGRPRCGGSATLRRGGLARLGDHLRAARGRVPLPEAGEVGAHSSGGPGARGASSRQRDCLSLLSRSLGPFRRRAAPSSLPALQSFPFCFRSPPDLVEWWSCSSSSPRDKFEFPLSFSSQFWPFDWFMICLDSMQPSYSTQSA